MDSKQKPLYEFDEFCLDTNQKCLLHSDEIVSLTPKAYETLLVLIKNRGQVVGKEKLLDEVWTDTFVEESTLAQNILTLRKTFAAFEKDKQFIVTVPRRGYRFAAEVREILGDEEIVVVEKRTKTHFVAEQIHDSADAPNTAIVPNGKTGTNIFSKYKIAEVVLLGIFVLTVGFAVSRFYFSPPKFVQTKFQKFNVGNLMSSADIKKATLSPNGKYLALIETRNDGQYLSLRQTENGNTIDLVPKANGNFTGAAFSPDGERIYYSIYENGTNENSVRKGSLYKIPLLGGASQKIIDDIDSPAAVSPDEKQIAFVRRNPQLKESYLIVTDIEGGNERTLAVRKFGEGFYNTGAAFSPDGKLISCTVSRRDENGQSAQIAVIDAKSGEQKIISKENWIWAGQTAWLKDGSGIAVVAYGSKSPNLTDEVWFVSYPEGKARVLTNGINGIYGISLSADSNSIVAVKSNKITNFLISPLNDLETSNSILTKTGDESLLPLGADWTNDDQIVYSAITNGNADIRTMNADGSGQKQLTSDASAELLPKVTSDGRFMIFLSNRSGAMNVWRTNADGTNPKNLTENENVISAVISPDGKTVFYIAKAKENLAWVLWKMSIEGDNKTQITSRMTYAPKISPDGKMIACFFANSEDEKMALSLLSSENGEVIKQLNIELGENPPMMDWMKDGKNLLLASNQNGTSSLWKQPIDGGKMEKLHEWQNDSIFRFAVSSDGEKIFYEKGIETNTVLILRDASSEMAETGKETGQVFNSKVFLAAF